MNIAQTTYGVLAGAFGPIASRNAAATENLAPSMPVQDRFEFSRVMGAADALPGQQTSASASGVCPNCGSVHGMASPEGAAAPAQINGTSVPDLHVMGADSASQTSPSVCPDCGRAHGSSSGSAETPVRINGVDVPDLHAVAGDAQVGAAEEMDGKPDSEPADGQTQPERDPATGDVELDEQGQQKVDYLKQRDREVRTHEHAHVAAGGQYVRGGIQFEYENGPDGRRYAVGGEVSIDTSPVSGDPQATIQKAQTVRRAALAPAEPSGQDRRAAAAASQMETKARQELIEEKLETPDEAGQSGEMDAEAGLAATDEIEAPEMPDLGDAPDGNAVGDLAGPDAAGRHEDESASGLSVAGEASEAHTPSVASVRDPQSDSIGVSIRPPKSEDRGLDVGQADDDLEGLPEISTPAATPPVAKLDYGVTAQRRQLVDLYG